MNNQECKIRTKIINLNTTEPMSYPYSVKINRCKDSCNTTSDPYEKICVPNEIKNTNIKVFILMSRTNVTRHIEWRKTRFIIIKINNEIHYQSHYHSHYHFHYHSYYHSHQMNLNLNHY